MSQNDLAPLITALEVRVDEAERKANVMLGALNELRAEAGLPPRPPGVRMGATNVADTASSTPTRIKADTFFGKKQQTAVREYLEMRRSAGEGPATPRAIYDALVAGGYKYGAKDANTALVGLRAMLRKRTNVFIRVGDSGVYGLRAWYPDAKQPKDAGLPESDNKGNAAPSDTPHEAAAQNETTDEGEAPQSSVA